MKALGNKKSNEIWEYKIPLGYEKITSHSPRGTRIKYLTDKYVFGKFRKDYISTGPKMFSEKQNKKEEIRNILLETLKDDEKFRNTVVQLIFNLNN